MPLQVGCKYQRGFRDGAPYTIRAGKIVTGTCQLPAHLLTSRTKQTNCIWSACCACACVPARHYLTHVTRWDPSQQDSLHVRLSVGLIACRSKSGELAADSGARH